jgi:hypothetical protein
MYVCISCALISEELLIRSRWNLHNYFFNFIQLINKEINSLKKKLTDLQY